MTTENELQSFWNLLYQKKMNTKGIIHILMNEKKQEIDKDTSIPVFSQRLAGYLMQRGFVLVAMEPDKKHNRRNVFFFKDSDLLHQAINQYKA